LDFKIGKGLIVAARYLLSFTGAVFSMVSGAGSEVNLMGSEETISLIFSIFMVFSSFLLFFLRNSRY